MTTFEITKYSDYPKDINEDLLCDETFTDHLLKDIIQCNPYAIDIGCIFDYETLISRKDMERIISAIHKLNPNSSLLQKDNLYDIILGYIKNEDNEFENIRILYYKYINDNLERLTQYMLESFNYFNGNSNKIKNDSTFRSVLRIWLYEMYEDMGLICFDVWSLVIDDEPSISDTSPRGALFDRYCNKIGRT